MQLSDVPDRMDIADSESVSGQSPTPPTRPDAARRARRPRPRGRRCWPRGASGPAPPARRHPRPPAARRSRSRRLLPRPRRRPRWQSTPRRRGLGSPHRSKKAAPRPTGRARRCRRRRPTACTRDTAFHRWSPCLFFQRMSFPGAGSSPSARWDHAASSSLSGSYCSSSSCCRPLIPE